MNQNDDRRPLSARALLALGLTGALTSAVSCGPCLDIAIPDTGEENDTGDTGDTEEGDVAPAPASEDRAQAAHKVLSSGVLPDDVARMILAKQRQQTPTE